MKKALRVESHYLTYLTARFDIFRCRHHAEALVGIHGRENHALTLDTHHLAGCEIRHEENALADEFLGILIEGSDTGADGAISTRTVVDGKLQEFLAFLHLLTVLHQTHTDIEFLKFLKRYGILNRSSLVVGSLVGLLGGFQFVELLLDHLVLDLLEEQGWFRRARMVHRVDVQPSRGLCCPIAPTQTTQC